MGNQQGQTHRPVKQSSQEMEFYFEQNLLNLKKNKQNLDIDELLDQYLEQKNHYQSFNKTQLIQYIEMIKQQQQEYPKKFSSFQIFDKMLDETRSEQIIILIKNHDLEQLKIIHQKGEFTCNNDLSQGQYWNAIHYACLYDSYQICEYLLKDYYKKNDSEFTKLINATTSEGWTALLVCAIKNSTRCMTVLLKCGGIGANYKDKWGCDIIQMTQLYQNFRIMEIIQKKIYDATKPNKTYLLANDGDIKKENIFLNKRNMQQSSVLETCQSVPPQINEEEEPQFSQTDEIIDYHQHTPKKSKLIVHYYLNQQQPSLGIIEFTPIIIQNRQTSFVSNYQDNEFLHEKSSISTNPLYLYSYLFNQTKWIRAHEILQQNIKEITLFGSMNQNYIPGYLRLTSFYSILVGLSRFPDIVKKLFVQQEAQESGIYDIIFQIMGKQTKITVDDFIPCDVKSFEPFFTKILKNIESSIWSQMLEKAWVKICKSYMSTDLIIADEIIEEIVGCPCYGMKLQQFKDDKEDKILIEILKNIFKQGFQLWGLLNPIQKLDLNNNGYFISIQNIIQREFKFFISFQNNQITNQILNNKNYDSQYQMQLDNFKLSFNYLSVACYRQNYKLQSLAVKSTKNKSIYFKITTKEPQEVNIRIRQLNKIIANNIKYKYSPFDCFLYAKDEQDRCTLISTGDPLKLKGASSVSIINNNNNNGFITLYKNTYFLKIKMQWINQQQNEFVISIYAQNEIQIEQIDKKESRNTYEKCLEQYKTNETRNFQVTDKIHFEVISLQNIRLLHFKNLSLVPKQVLLEVQIANKNFKLQKRHRNSSNSFKFKIEPGQKDYAIVKQIILQSITEKLSYKISVMDLKDIKIF